MIEGFAPHPPPKAFLKITTQVSPTIMVTSLLLELNASFCELAVMIYVIFEEINTSSFDIACSLTKGLVVSISIKYKERV